MRQVICLNIEIMQHAGFSFSLFGNCMVVPKIIVIFKLDKENPIQFCFQNKSRLPLVFIFIEFQGYISETVGYSL